MAQFVWKCFENWEFHLYKCIHTLVFEVQHVPRQSQINWERRLPFGNGAITAGYEEHMSRSFVGFKFRPISKGSLFEPDEYLYSFSSETISAKHTSLHFFFYYEFKILKAIDFISPDDEAAALIKTSWIIFIIAC